MQGISLRHSKAITPIIGIILLGVAYTLSPQSAMYYYLTIAQLVFVPILLEQILNLRYMDRIVIVVGQVAVLLLTFYSQEAWWLAGIYFIVTCYIAWLGIRRFMARGFVAIEECCIDIGIIYLAMGGAWFFAYQAKINTGFSELITWLTAIHFHYSAFLLVITVGLFGRMYKGKWYFPIAFIIVTGPLVVAMGITFSRWIEIIGASFYVLALFMWFFLLFNTPIPKIIRWPFRIAIGAICFTIIWSLLYAFSNFTGSGLVTIPDMLQFHGRINCYVFGVSIVLTWILYMPVAYASPSFPISNLTGKNTPYQEKYHALVDDMSLFVTRKQVAPKVLHFYEDTMSYQLYARVTWASWFRPLAIVFHLISKYMAQLHLPITKDEVKMDGQIHMIDPKIDGREKPRVWQRSINGAIVFRAVYATHHSDRTYMNIALPLPFSCMHGILRIDAHQHGLYLTSRGSGDAGTYLSTCFGVMKLPLHEDFKLFEREGNLYATHDMTVFGIHFLHIDYRIEDGLSLI